MRFGAFEFVPETGELRRAGRIVRLRPQASQVLAILANRPGELVTREELRRAVWGDSTHVEFEQALDNVVWQMRTALRDTSRAPLFVETLARRGYRFLAPVTREEPGCRPDRPGQALASPQPSIAVLPFEALSEGTAARSFAAEMTDELVTLLSQRPKVSVVSHESVMAALGSNRDLRELARFLGADLVVDGSIVLSEGLVRINVRLIDACVDTHLWARSFERRHRDELALQRRVASLLVEQICESATRAERSRPLSTGRSSP